MSSVEAGQPQDWRDSLPRQVREVVDQAMGFDPETLSTPGVVGLAVGAAVALGSLVMALGPGEEVVEAPPQLVAEPRRAAQEKRRLTMVEKPMTAVIKNGKLTRRTRKQLHKQADQLQKEIDRLAKVARVQVAVQQRAPAANEAREAAAQFGDNVGKRLAAVGAATAAAAAPLFERARSSDFPDQVREGARSFAGTTRDRTSDLGDRVRDEFVPLIVDRASRVQDRVRDDVAPQIAGQFGRVRDEFVPQVADRLQHVRDDIFPQVAERLQQVRDDVVPQVAERLQQVRDEFAPQAADAAAKAGTRVSALAATGAAASRDAYKNLANTDPGERAADLAASLGKQTKRGRKKAAAALSDLAAQIEPQQKRGLSGIWIFALVAAIGGALYYVFMDEERRKKITEGAKSVVEQGREIVRDFQGYDEEF